MNNEIKILMLQYSKMYREVIKKSESLTDTIFTRLTEINTNYPTRDNQNDIRFTIFSRIKNTLLNCKLSIINLISNGKILETIPNDQFKNRLEEYDKYLRFSYFQHNFSQVESGIRVIMRQLDKKSYYSKKAPFNNIYQFLNDYLKVKNYKYLFRIIRNIRNSIHNNGIFYPDNNKNDEIEYRGIKIRFEIESPISCVSWITIFDITEDLLFALKEILESPILANIALIYDPIPKE